MVKETRSGGGGSFWRSFYRPIEKNCKKRILPDKVDRLFSHDAARMTFLKFRRYPIEQGYEVSFLSLICLDAIVTDEVDGLKIELNEIANMNNKYVVLHPGDGERSPFQSFARRMKSIKGGTIPRENSYEWSVCF